VNGRSWRIALKKSFLADDKKFSEPLVRLMRCEGPLRLTQKRPPTPVLVLQSLAAAEITDVRLREIFGARDFRLFQQYRRKAYIRPLDEVRKVPMLLQKSVEIALEP
jgi:hypothetical protein